MVIGRQCHSNTEFSRCWAKLTETYGVDGRCETAAALLASSRAPVRITKSVPEPVWKATAPRNYTGYFDAAIARLKVERRYRSFVDLERIAGSFPSAIWHSPDGPREITVPCPSGQAATVAWSQYSQ